MTQIADLEDRLRRLAWRREQEGIYTDAMLADGAAARIADLEAQLDEARKALGEIEQEARSLPLHTSAVTRERVLTSKLDVVRDAARRALTGGE